MDKEEIIAFGGWYSDGDQHKIIGEMSQRLHDGIIKVSVFARRDSERVFMYGYVKGADLRKLDVMGGVSGMLFAFISDVKHFIPYVASLFDCECVDCSLHVCIDYGCECYAVFLEKCIENK